jgi:DNA polymerase I-like protein with 3'-5' exonuclease and polymerase domains/intein/homing endonuclease
MTYVALIRVIGIATSKRSVAVAWNLLPQWLMSYWQLVLGKIPVHNHHGIYDRSVLRAYGFILPMVGIDENAPVWMDSLYAHHAAFPGNSHKLQVVTSQFFGTKPWKAEYRGNEETPENLAKYCAGDVGSTHANVNVLQVWVKRTNTERVYERDKKMADIASQMHLAGMPVSREVNSQLVSTFTRLAREAKRVVDDKANDPKIQDAIKHHLAIMLAQKARKADSLAFEDRYELRLADLRNRDWRWNANNSKHVAAFLQAMGVSLFQTTEGGAISTKKDVLEGLVDVPIVRDILKARENFKMLDFVGPIFDREEIGQATRYGFADDNDRIHPIWSIHKISGRWAGSEPHGVSNPPREKPRELPEGTFLPPGTIVIDVLCAICREAQGAKHDKMDHPFKAGPVIIAERPTTKRQVVTRKGRTLVGFDFCLAKGTLIDTPNGHQPIEKLKSGDLVYSFNWATKRPDCSRITAQVCTGKQKTMRVVLDNGEEVRCTYNHRWLVRPWGCGVNAIEVEAKNLKSGDRLLPLRRTLSGPARSYETLYSYSAFEYVKTHVVVARAALGERPEGFDVHHKNDNSLDNRPDNLEYKLKHDHLAEHTREMSIKMWKDPKIRKKMCDGISKALEARGGHHGKNNPNYGNRSGEEWHCPNCDKPTYFGGKNPKKFCSRNCYYEFRRKNPSKRGTKYTDLNHKVAAVYHDDVVVQTYDIEVERDHNFALSAGVFVHNCAIEARILALISGDPFMCEVFGRADGDLHTECAIDVFPGFKDRPAKERKMMRTVCKTLEYATWYGAADEKVWKGLLKEGYNFKLVDVVGALNILRKKMPGIIRWQRETIHRASQPPFELHDFVTGRRRVWPMGQVEASEALNIVPQSTGSAIMNMGLEKMMARIYDRGYKQAFPIAQIHDAAVFECWEDDAEALAKDVEDCFTYEHEGEDGLRMRFPIEIGIGNSWADV